MISMCAEIIDNTIYVIGRQDGWYIRPVQYFDTIEKLDLNGLSIRQKD